MPEIGVGRDCDTPDEDTAAAIIKAAKKASEPRCDDCCTDTAVEGSCRNLNCHKPNTHKTAKKASE